MIFFRATIPFKSIAKKHYSHPVFTLKLKAFLKLINVFVFLFIGMSSTVSAEANSHWSERIQTHGFASQALIFTTDNNFFGDSEHGSADFTELGLNASFKLSPNIRLAAQLISRHAGEFYNGSPWLDYALIDINFMSTHQHQLGSYIGRVKNPVGLYNDTRDVAHTRQGVFAPQVIYFDKVRNLIMSADGLHLYSNHFLSTGNLLIQAGAGYALPDKNVEYAYMGQNWAGELEGNNLSFFGRVMYEHDGGRWIFSLSGANLSIDFDHEAADSTPFPAGAGLNSGDIELDYAVLSTQYNGEKWQFTAEVALEHTNFDGIGTVFDKSGFDSIGYYAQLDYKFSHNWQAFIRYEEFQLNKDDWNGKKAAKESQQTSQFLSGFGIQQPASPAHVNYAKTWVIGGHWDINKSLRLRSEYHISEGVATLSPRENSIPLTAKYWDMFTISLSYHF